MYPGVLVGKIQELKLWKGYYHSSTDVGYLQNVCASAFGSPLTNVFSTSTRGEGPIPRDADLITVDPQTVDSNTVYADIIGIHWAETDAQVLRLLSETSSSSPTAASTNAAQTAQGPTPIASPTGSAASTSTPRAGGLSTGTEAGIGIGAVAGAIALALFANFLWRRRRKASNIRGGNNEVAPPQYRAAQELHSEQLPAELPSNGQKAQELPANEVSELGSNAVWSRTTGTMFSGQKQGSSYL